MTQPVIISPENHIVRPKHLPNNVKSILETLQQEGFEAYAVGGCVRDVLLGIAPKDFDLVTNAHPEQIRKLFGNCRLIGRRFRLAHIYFGRDIVEVATFRGQSEESDGARREHPETGMIVHDNEYGTIEDDIWRRDFTVNALYYNLQDGSLIDYCGAMADLQAKRLELIGEPSKRFIEDPVRMLRAIRLATKLGLTLSDEVQQRINRSAHLLANVSVARLYEEVLKLFITGHAHTTYQTLQAYDLLTYLLPQTEQLAQEHPRFQALVDQALINTDRRIQDDKSINPAFLLAVFLWQPYLQRLQDSLAYGTPYFEAKQLAFDLMYKEQALTVSIPRRFQEMIRQMWDLQGRLEKPHPRHVQKILENRRFRAAYDFLVLRSTSTDPNLQKIAAWWTKLQEVPADEQAAMIKELKVNNGGKGKKSPRKRKLRQQQNSNHSRSAAAK